MPNKVYVQGMVDKEVADEFFLNAIHAYGFKHGSKGVSLEQSLKMFNSYFRVYNDLNMLQIAEKLGLEPYEIGKLLIKVGVEIHIMHRNYEDGMDMGPGEVHEQLRKKYKILFPRKR